MAFNPATRSMNRVLLALALVLACLRAQSQSVSTLCHFTAGPRAGTDVDYAPRPAIPVGIPCNDGVMSVGVIVPMPIRTAYIEKSDLPSDPGPQRTPVTCWAASIAYVLAYFKHPVDQTTILHRYYPNPSLGSPMAMSAALNATWTDTNGQQVTLTSQVTNTSGMGSPSTDVDNSDVVDALANDTPVFYGDTHHAMVLVEVHYLRHQNGAPPTILDGVVWDPNPIYHGSQQAGYRQVSGPDLQAIFVAIPSAQ